MIINKSYFGDALKQIRMDRNISQEELGVLLNTSKQVISRYETGQRTPKITVVMDYAKKLEVPIEYFLGDLECERKEYDANLKRFRQNLKDLMQNNNEAIHELAHNLGVSNTTISGWLNGNREPSTGAVKKIAEYYKCPPSWIMGWEENIEGDNPVNTLELDGVYLSFAQKAQNEGIDPDDISAAIKMIKKIRDKE